MSNKKQREHLIPPEILGLGDDAAMVALGLLGNENSVPAPKKGGWADRFDSFIRESFREKAEAAEKAAFRSEALTGKNEAFKAARAARRAASKKYRAATRGEGPVTAGRMAQAEAAVGEYQAARQATSKIFEKGVGKSTLGGVFRTISRKAPLLRGGLTGVAPFLVAPALRMAAGAGEAVVDPFKRLLTGTGIGELSSDTQLHLQEQRDEAAWQIEQKNREVEEIARMNEQRLMQVAPDLANQILAGRRLPQGALVLGGRPRTDLMREFARQMATEPPQQQEQFP